MSVAQALTERQSIKTFDPDISISQDEITQILTLANQSPSAFNNQSWRVKIIQNQSDKQKLLPIAYHQSQIATASAVFVILGDTHAYTPKAIGELVQTQVAQGFIPQELQQKLTDSPSRFYANLSDSEQERYLALEAGLFSMSLMLIAQSTGWHTAPMTGYNRTALRQAFGIDERYQDMMLIAIGKPKTLPRQSFRYPLSHFVI